MLASYLSNKLPLEIEGHESRHNKGLDTYVVDVLAEEPSAGTKRRKRIAILVGLNMPTLRCQISATNDCSEFTVCITIASYERIMQVFYLN